MRHWIRSRVWVCALVASFGGLLFGYNTTTFGLVASAAATNWSLNEPAQHLLNGIFFVGAIIGAFLIGRFGDALSRRDVISTSAACYAFTGFACAIASRFEELVIARLFLGIVVGVTSLAVPLYLAEISDAKNRGAIVSLNQLSITLGIVLAFVLERNGWILGESLSNLYTVGGILAVVVSAGAIILPESPAWLIKQGDDVAARDVLKKLDRPHVLREIAEIKEGMAVTDRNPLVALLQPSNRRLLGIGMLLFALQQFSGINYILLTISSPGAGDSGAALFRDILPGWSFVITVGIVNLLGSLVFVALVDRIGRRPLLLIGMCGLAAALVALVFDASGPTLPEPVGTQKPFLIVYYVFFFAISLGPVPWLFVAEMFPLAVRGISMSIPITVNWIANAIMIFVALSLDSPTGTLAIFSISLAAIVVGIPLCIRLFPETKQLRFSQIRSTWHKSGTPQEKTEIAATLTTILSTIGGILFGYNLTVIAGALLSMNTKFHLDPFSSGLIVSSILVGAMLGSLASGHLAAAFGRRSMLMTTTVVLIVGSAVSGLSDTVVTLVIGRFVTGIATGVSASIISLYISEISPATIRGRLNSILHLAMVIGALTASVVTTVLMSEPDGWRAMLYLGSIPALAMVVGTLFLPESPRWLISKSRVSTAKLMLEKLCVSDPDQEIARIQESAEQAQTRNRSTPLWSPTVRPALLIGLALMFFQACTGINIVSFYGPTIFQAAGIKSATDANFLAAVSGGPIGVIMTLFSFQLVDRLGRRPLFLLGVIGLLASSVGFGIAFALLDAGIHAVQAMIFLCFFVFVASFTVSVNIVCGVMISELYPQSVRDRAIGFVTAFNLLCAIVASFVFPMLVDAAGFSVVFFLNAGITALAIPFWHLFMPETRGKSLEEIEKHWLGGGRPAALR